VRTGGDDEVGLKAKGSAHSPEKDAAMAATPTPRLSSFAIERPGPLAPPTVAPPIPPQALLEAVAALDAASRGLDGGGHGEVLQFLSRALGGGARRADVRVAACGDCGDDAAACSFLVSRRVGPLAARVSALGVRPSCRRRGLATALVRACAKGAAAGRERRPAPVVLLTLAVARTNHAARALYERLGFKLKKAPDDEGDDEDDLEMEASFDLEDEPGVID
jgi:ribosomal protein S18 acetylase RimI-like enzyme